MATGYMTLPLPVIGNSRYAVNPNASSNSTLNEGPTPAPYWAVLWNRALKIIDNHHHWEALSTSGGTTGKQLKWGGSENGIRICRDLNLENKILYETLGLGFSSYIFNLKFLGISQKANIYEPIGDFNVNENLHSEVDGKFPINNTFYQRWSIYGRLSYNRASFSGSGGGTTNYNYQPSRDLIWNNGGADKEGTVIIDNCPGGPIRGPYDTSLFPSFVVDGLPNESSAVEPYINQEWNTNAPFAAILDNGKEGIYATREIPTGTGLAYPPSYWAGVGWTKWMKSGLGSTGSVFIQSAYLVSRDWYENPTNTTVFDTPNAYDDSALRMGKYIWISDGGGDASTYPQKIAPEDTTAGYSDNPSLSWWDSSAGIMKHWSASMGAPTYELFLDQDYESILLVVAYTIDGVPQWFAYFK